jgi:hypothetical protein
VYLNPITLFRIPTKNPYWPLSSSTDPFLRAFISLSCTFPLTPSNADILKASGIVPLTFGQQRSAIPEPEEEDNPRKDITEVQNASAHRMEALEVGRCFVEHKNTQGQQHHTFGQNRPATAEAEVDAIKQEESSRNDVEVQNASSNRIKTSDVGVV